MYSTRDPVRRGGAVIIRVPEAAAVYAELEERGGPRRLPSGCRDPRIGPHFFATDDELQLVITQIAEIVESGAYARHAGAAASTDQVGGTTADRSHLDHQGSDP